MSRHTFTTIHRHRSVRVEMGFDRRLQYIYMTVIYLDEDPTFIPSDEEDEENPILYCNTLDDAAGLECKDVNYFRRILETLDLAVPESMFMEVMRDQQGNVGNRLLSHNSLASQQP